MRRYMVIERQPWGMIRIIGQRWTAWGASWLKARAEALAVAGRAAFKWDDLTYEVLYAPKAGLPARPRAVPELWPGRHRQQQRQAT